MRAAVFHGRQDLRLEDVPEPVAKPGEVKLRVLYNGICGSDLHEYYLGRKARRSWWTSATPQSLPEIDFDLHAIGVKQKELTHGATWLIVGSRVYAVALQACKDFIIIPGAEGDVINRSGSVHRC
jgi:threonine dehydrogenase-like Zn-dependent dehydrogenase